MIRCGWINQHKAIWMENEQVLLSILPEKGADIYEFIYKPLAIDFLMKTPCGLKPPASDPPIHFLENYEGAWQELFPNANAECSYRGKLIPFHGEVALLPWSVDLIADDEDTCMIKLSVVCKQTPFYLQKIIKLLDSNSDCQSPGLEISETIANISQSSAEFVGGQHIVLGGNFLEEGCYLNTSARYIETPSPEEIEDTARLKPSQITHYPFAQNRHTDQSIDIRTVPSAQIHTHDDAFLTGFREGRLEVSNPRLKLRLRMEWDKDFFPWVVLWQPYGGAIMPPLQGIYGLGIEPWISRFNLSESVQRNCAVSLKAGKSIQTTFRLLIDHS